MIGQAWPDITTDDLWPRDAEHRYRLYARIGDSLHVLAAAESMSAIGVAIETLHRDAQSVGRRLCDEGRIGILDVLDGTSSGDWIIPLWDRGLA